MGWALWWTIAGALAHDLKEDPRVIMTWKAHGIEVIVRETGTPKAVEETVEDAPPIVLPPDPAPKPGSPGVLVLEIPPGSYIPSVELTCENEGYRARAPVFQGKAVFMDVPDAECIVHFKGGEVMNHQKIRRAGTGVLLLCDPVHASRIECRRIDPVP